MERISTGFFKTWVMVFYIKNNQLHYEINIFRAEIELSLEN